VSKRKLHWTHGAAREAERLTKASDRIASIPVLTPITTRARPLNPALWGNLDGDAL
jgi:hypothetical protein